jgi:hypothetical protein
LAREEAVRTLSRYKAERPWEERIRQRQADIRTRYLAFANQMSRSDDPADRALSARIRSFVEEMPPLETRRHALRQELARMSALRKLQREPLLWDEGRRDGRPGKDRSR